MNIQEKYTELERELNTLIGGKKFDAEKSLKLERITLLLERIGNPQNTYKTIHVGGTAGKGSTATMIANILQAHGHSVGLHTSPHLQILNERHVVNGTPLSTTALSVVWNELRPHIEWMREHCTYGPPTYFEAQIILSFLAFKHAGVKYAVIEVGLGGTLDGTNVITPVLSVLTNVDLDHTEILGDTVEEIAADKAGIIKPGVPVVTGASQPSVLEIFEQRADKYDAKIYILHKDFDVPRDLKLTLTGEKQYENAALALFASEQVLDDVFNTDHAHQALSQTVLPARIEIMQTTPTVILDGAHNPAKISASLRTVKDLSANKTLHVLISLKEGKDSVGILEPILALSQNITCTEFTQAAWSAVRKEQLQHNILTINPDATIHLSDNPVKTAQDLLQTLGSDDVLWIVGSLYLAGEVREVWFPKEKLLRDLE